MKTFEIIPFSPAHAAQTAEVEKQCFSEPWSENSLLSQFERKDSEMFVAVSNDRVIGWAGLEHIFGEGSVLNIAVSPDFRRLGVGKALTKRLIDKSAELSLEWLMLEVRVSNNAAISLYENLGFSHIGKRPNFYSHPREDALLMRYNFKE